MYYKIENKKSDVFNKLKDLREKELAIEKNSIKLIEEKVGQKFTNYLGYAGQQGFNRVRTYVGFEFEKPDELDKKTWKKHKDHPTIFEPYLRTKKGREMKDFIDGLENSYYTVVYKILDLEHLHRFKTPYVELVDDNTIILMLDDKHNPKDENVVEITSKEFDKLFESIKE